MILDCNASGLVHSLETSKARGVRSSIDPFIQQCFVNAQPSCLYLPTAMQRPKDSDVENPYIYFCGFWTFVGDSRSQCHKPVLMAIHILLAMN